MSGNLAKVMRNRNSAKTALGGSVDDNDDDQKKNKRNLPLSLIIVGLFFVSTVGLLYRWTETTTFARDDIVTNKHVVRMEISPQVKVRMDFDVTDGENDVVSLGPHKVFVSVDEACHNAAFRLFLEGDALVFVYLEEDSNKRGWHGSFDIPLEGTYRVMAVWSGCDPKDQIKQTLTLHEVRTKGIRQTNSTSSNRSFLYPESAWISSSKFPQIDTVLPPYIWMNPSTDPNEANLLKLEDTVLAKEGTFTEHGFYQFPQLSNYELVCWIGSDSAQKIHGAFRQIRPQIASGQRPFKFHYYPMNDFQSPDTGWNQEQQTKFRKCKHILVSVDEIKEALSQAEYMSQVKKFLNHLVKAFPDDTFPIWMFTVNESPMHSTNCHSPSLPRSTDHPCNSALKSLFGSDTFPGRVQLLDNTDLTLPQHDANEKHMIAVIALRIYVFVGKQVKEWRAVGQKGTVNGLERGGRTEPNFELIPYTGWDE